jgi:hypothetical protein
MGQAGSHWQLTAGIGLPRAPRLPQTVAGGLASLVGRDHGFTFVGAEQCQPPSVSAGRLTVTEAVIDDAGVERFRGSMTLTCTNNRIIRQTTSEIRYHALG